MSMKRIKRRLNVFLEIFGLPRLASNVGTIYLITTSSQSKGEQDFKRVLEDNNIRIERTLRMDLSNGKQALANAIRRLGHALEKGDIVAIVRGGGDIRDKQFQTFRDPNACRLIDNYQDENGVKFVSGVGHASDTFEIDKHVEISAITPTDAARHVISLVKNSEYL